MTRLPRTGLQVRSLIAFDAVGGGRFAGQILVAMETSLVRRMTGEIGSYGKVAIGDKYRVRPRADH
jgi:hypothetical protein